MHLLDVSAEVDGNVICQWLNINHSKLNTSLISLSTPVFSQLIHKVISSEHISKEALVTVTEALRINLVTVPEGIPLNNAAVLIGQQWLAPTASVFEKLYQELHQEGEALTPLLYNLICIRPALLNGNYELVLYADEQFDRGITRLILNGGQFADDICISILNWLWEKDEALLSEGPLLSQQALTRFSAKLVNERQKQALLIQCLKEGRASQAFVRSVLQTFRHPNYAAFLIERNYRSIVYSDAIWRLAVQLGKCEFISPPKLTHENTRIRIEPFRNTEMEYDQYR